MKAVARWLVGLVACGALSGAAVGAPCAGFSDVDSTHAFCPNVEWMKNRSITLGCTSTTAFCPNDPVSRLAMAAFMNRLGTALTAQQLLVDTTTGTIDLDLSPVVCTTNAYTVTGYPRRAVVDLAFAGQAPTSLDFTADLVVTANNGSTWTSLNTAPSRVSVAGGQWGSIANLAVRDLDVGQSVRFGVRMSRAAGSGDLTSARCNLRVQVGNRDAASSPF
jgi:hypothetical protein